MSDLTELIRQYVLRYRTRVAVRAGVLVALGLAVAALLWVQLTRLELGPWWALGAPGLLGAAGAGALAWWVGRRWIAPAQAAGQLDRALGLKERLITASEFSRVDPPPPLYGLLIDDTEQRLSSAALPRVLDRTTIALAVLAFLLWLWPWRIGGLTQLAQLIPPETPPPSATRTPETPPPIPQPPSPSGGGSQDRQQEGGGQQGQQQQQQQSSGQDQQQRGGQGQDSQQGDGQSGQSGQGQAGSSGQAQAGGAREGAQGQQGGATGQGMQGAQPQSGGRQAGDSGEGQSNTSGAGQTAANAQAAGTQPGGVAQGEAGQAGSGPNAGGDSAAIQAEIRELLNEMKDEMKRMQAELEGSSEASQSEAPPGTDTDTELWEDPMSFEVPEGGTLPIQLDADVSPTGEARSGGGTGEASGEVDRDGPRMSRENVSLSNSPEAERAQAARFPVPPEYQPVVDRLKEGSEQ